MKTAFAFSLAMILLGMVWRINHPVALQRGVPSEFTATIEDRP